MSGGFSSVKLRDDLTDAIDKVVDEKIDELELPMFKSRADFVSKACKHFLKELLEGEIHSLHVKRESV